MTNEYKVGEKDNRPWGTWEVTEVGTQDNGDAYTKKTITVLPGASLSLQSHEHREEFWTIVEGKPTVLVGDEEKQYNSGDEIHIPKQAKHRMTNKTDETIVFHEIQVGKILDEKDITRYEDVYGRDTKTEQAQPCVMAACQCKGHDR